MATDEKIRIELVLPRRAVVGLGIVVGEAMWDSKAEFFSKIEARDTVGAAAAIMAGADMAEILGQIGAHNPLLAEEIALASCDCEEHTAKREAQAKAAN